MQEICSCVFIVDAMISDPIVVLLLLLMRWCLMHSLFMMILFGAVDCFEFFLTVILLGVDYTMLFVAQIIVLS